MTPICRLATSPRFWDQVRGGGRNDLPLPYGVGVVVGPGPSPETVCEYDPKETACSKQPNKLNKDGKQ